jgi:protein gp37
MAQNSKIEWTESTWNPVTGCTKISAGCKNCYAERMASRLKAAGSPNYANGFEVALHPHVLEIPLRWRRPRTIFVNSMSDLFHKDVPLDFISRIFEVMHRASHHRFQILTKRSQRLLQLNSKLTWPENVWTGVTVENAECAFRIDHLRQTGAAIKFISLEPFLGPIPNIDLKGIDWVIVGGESGPRARPMALDWAIDIRDQCLAADVPFFFKQWGGVNKKKAGRTLEDRTWDEMPQQIRKEVLVTTDECYVTHHLGKVCSHLCETPDTGDLS